MFKIKFITIILIFVPVMIFSMQKMISINNVLDSELNKNMLEFSSYVGVDNFPMAKKIAKSIISKYSNHPVGYFLMAAYYDSKMIYDGNSFLEKKLFKMCDQTIEKGERVLVKNPDDLWVQFFIAGATGYKGNFDMRYKRYIPAFRNGLASVDLLKEISKKDDDFVDVLYGVGYYNYFSSTMAKALWWMPGVADKRAIGIKQMMRVVDEGSYARIPASTGLVSILIDEKREPEAFKLATRMLKEFPNGRMFLYSLAISAYATKKYSKSENILLALWDEVDSKKKNNYVWNIRCFRYLSNIYYKKKMFIKSAAFCRRGLRIKFNDIDIKLAEEHIDNLNSLLKKLDGKY